MKIYISGKITGLNNYKDIFNAKKIELESEHKIVMPIHLICNTYEEYMYESFILQKDCNASYFLRNHANSSGALMEEVNAKRLGHTLLYEAPTKLESIAFMVEFHEGVTLEEMKLDGNTNKNDRIAAARAIFYYVAWKTRKYSDTEIALFINKSRSSVHFMRKRAFDRADLQEKIKKYI